MRTASNKPNSSASKYQSLKSKAAAEPFSRWLFVGAALAAVLVFLGAYSNSIHNGFHFDDMHVIVDNLFIRDLGNIPRFFADAQTSSSLPANSMYRPLVLATAAVDYQLGGGLDPFWFHVTQLTLMLATGVMLFLLYVRLFASAETSVIHRWMALFAATLYCVHTANTETVNYIVTRSELLAGAGVLGAFMVYIYAPGSRRFYLYLLPLIVGVLGKTPAVMFAPLLLVYMLLIEEQLSLPEIFSRRAWPRVRPVLLRAAPVFVVGVVLFLLVEGMNPATVNYGGVGRMQYFTTQTWVWLHYFRQFFIPTGLSADTDLKAFTTWVDPRVFAGLLFLAVSLAAIWRTSRTRELRPVAFGIAWFWIALFPSSSIFPLAEVTNDHRAFFPYMGLTPAVAWWIAVRLRSIAGSVESRRRVAILAGAAGIIVIGAFAVGTYMRNRVWLNDETLWADVVKKSPNNGRGLMNYGLTQMAVGRYPIAKDYFTRASVLNPNYPLVYVNLGIVTDAMGDTANAEPLFKRALEIEPNYVGGHFFYARWLIRRGRAAEAIPLLARAISLSPADLTSRQYLLELYAATGDTANLATLVRETLAFVPNDSTAREYSSILSGSPPGTSAEWFQRGLERTRAGRHAPAAAAYRAALKLGS
nr:tetratricopeptide repeat protein [Gemmatimonadota bacterium]